MRGCARPSRAGPRWVPRPRCCARLCGLHRYGARKPRCATTRAIVAGFGERLTPRIDHPAHSLSYANRRRVEIGRALALHPRLLLLDEPTAGMNETETAEMLQLIQSLKARGLTILLIEHKLELVMRVSDRVMVLDNGVKIAEGAPRDVRHDHA